MSGCKHCRVEPNGDIPDDRKSLWVRNFMSLMGVNFDLQVWVTVKNDLAIDFEKRQISF